MALDALLQVAQVAAPRTDPAFDRGAPNTPAREVWMAAAKRYVQTRCAADLAKLPLLDGRRPRLYAVAVLTPEAYTAVMAQGTAEQRVALACRAGVMSYRDELGVSHAAPMEANTSGAPLATSAWLRTLQSVGGGQLLTELAAVVIRRYEIGDVEELEGADPLDLHHLGGLRLGR